MEEQQRKLIFAIDFDGTIVANAWPKIGDINMQAVDFILALQKRGHKWILYTMRENAALRQAVMTCLLYDLTPDAINDNLPELCKQFKNNPRKIYADCVIDDHNAGGLVWPWEMLEVKK